MLTLKTDHLLVETEQVQVDHWRASKMYHQKMPYHAILLNSYAKSNRTTKDVKNIVKKTLWIYTLPVYFTLRN